jgi:NO-binding membrane sensor protein with MHYT domain
MIFTYDPILVLFSVIVAIFGAYTCFDLVIRIRKSEKGVDKALLTGAAFAIGGSIWSMHFVAMLAVKLPIVIRYDVLMTLISGLVSVLMTAVALLIVSTGAYSFRRIVVAGIIMGLGISSMHYVGMAAIRGNCSITYSSVWVAISICIGMAASTASLWSAMALHGVWRRIVAALVMGISISGVHYTSMAGTSFLSIDNAIEFSQPILSPFSLGLVTAISTFIILWGTLLTLVPGRKLSPVKDDHSGNRLVNSGNHLSDTGHPTVSALTEAEFHIDKIPVLRNQKTYFVDIADIVSVSADGHYTTVQSKDNECHFCSHSLSRVEEVLDPQVFLRVHRSHIVNLNHVESFERQHDKGLVFMSGGEASPIPVSRTNIGKLQSVLGI